MIRGLDDLGNDPAEVHWIAFYQVLRGGKAGQAQHFADEQVEPTAVRSIIPLVFTRVPCLGSKTARALHQATRYSQAMCNRYRPPRAARLAEEFGLDVPEHYNPRDVFPRSPGWFVRCALHEADFKRELVGGQWGLIPTFAKEPKLPYSTNNARSEEVSAKASYKQPWARGQRCIIPAEVFWEPCWETGKNVWWMFSRVDGSTFGLAGLWNAWVDKESGEIQESYTMLTINADAHPLMSRMHKPDQNLPPDQQDKRMVVVLEPQDWDAWMAGTVDQARRLIGAAPNEVFSATAET